MHGLLLDLLEAMQGKMPKKTVLVQYLGQRLGLSRDRLSQLLREGRDRFWTETSVTRGRFPGTRGTIYRPLPLKTRKTGLTAEAATQF